jgi:acetoin:2,6-dichlorophenolindophenol oxidoreductase subunit alpha
MLLFLHLVIETANSAMTEFTDGSRRRRLETRLVIRTYEEQLVELQRNGAPGTCASVGQEACAVGVIDALEARDRILTNHRSTAHLLARGAAHGSSALHIA